jgi:hypothetical protein
MICLHWLSLVLACVACALIGAGYGAILGAERVRPTKAEPDETPTVTACRTCFRAVKDCRCLKVMRAVGRA